MMVRNSMALACSLFAITWLGGCKSDGGGGADATPCQPTTCLAQSKNCGNMPDGCGQVLLCGTCTGGESCGGGGTANVCGIGVCTPTTCLAQGKDCGVISDGCAGVLQCGTCIAPAVCGGGGTANVCGGGVTQDAGPGSDATVGGQCESSCMAQPGAECCLTCGCPGAAPCYPVCDAPYQWDCEIGCCFNYDTFQCL